MVYLLRVGLDEGGDLFPRLLDGSLGLPSVSVRSGVRIPILSDHVGEHRVDNTRILQSEQYWKAAQ